MHLVSSTKKPTLTFSVLLFPSRPAGALVLHSLQWCQRHVEVTVRTAPERAQTFTVEILGVLTVRVRGQY